MVADFIAGSFSSETVAKLHITLPWIVPGKSENYKLLRTRATVRPALRGELLACPAAPYGFVGIQVRRMRATCAGSGRVERRTIGWTRGGWRGWPGSIPSGWVRCGIAARKRKRI